MNREVHGVEQNNNNGGADSSSVAKSEGAGERKKGGDLEASGAARHSEQGDDGRGVGRRASKA
jgi:hypothetical protein